MIRYKIYFAPKEIMSVNHKSELFETEMVAKDEGSVREKFIEKYPYDRIFEITRSKYDLNYNILEGVLQKFASKNSGRIYII